MENNKIKGHLAAVFCALVWGTTFTSTKVLLQTFTPIEILFIRFVMGWIALTLVSPKPMKFEGWKRELEFIGAGVSGITLYYLCENIALTYTMAANVSIIIAVAPFFTALLAYWTLKQEKPKASFFAGFIVAILGIAMISFNGSVTLKMNPLGDLLAFGAALLWAVYSIFTKKLSGYGYGTIAMTKKIFTYGILFMIPPVMMMDFQVSAADFMDPVVLFNLIFLGLGASALCFGAWNFAVKVLGAVQSSVYIYAVPVVTVVTAVLVLHEPVTWMSAVGTVLTLAGLIISERRS